MLKPKIYSQSSAGYSYGSGDRVGGSASTYVNTIVGYDKNGNFRSSFVNGRQAGSTVIYAPSLKK